MHKNAQHFVTLLLTSAEEITARTGLFAFQTPLTFLALDPVDKRHEFST